MPAKFDDPPALALDICAGNDPTPARKRSNGIWEGNHPVERRSGDGGEKAFVMVIWFVVRS